MSEAATLDLSALLLGNQLASTLDPGVTAPQTGPHFSAILTEFQLNQQPANHVEPGNLTAIRASEGINPVDRPVLGEGPDFMTALNGGAPNSRNLAASATSNTQATLASLETKPIQAPAPRALAKQPGKLTRMQRPDLTAFRQTSQAPAPLLRAQAAASPDGTGLPVQQNTGTPGALTQPSLLNPQAHTARSKQPRLQKGLGLPQQQQVRQTSAHSASSAPTLRLPELDSAVSAKTLHENADLSLQQAATKELASAIQSSGIQLDRAQRIRSKLNRVITGVTAPAAHATELAPGERPLTPLVGEPSTTPRPAIQTEALASDIAAMRFSGQTQARVALRPAALGDVEIRLKVTQSGTEIELLAASDSAADLLTQSLPKLRAQLNAAGIQSSQIDVSTDQKNLGQSDPHSSRHSESSNSEGNHAGGTRNPLRGPSSEESGDLDSSLHMVSIIRQSRLLDALA